MEICGYHGALKIESSVIFSTWIIVFTTSKLSYEFLWGGGGGGSKAEVLSKERNPTS